MPILISADRWEIEPSLLGPNFSLNHGHELEISTADLLKSIDEVENRPEMQEVDSLLMSTPLYLKGKANG